MQTTTTLKPALRIVAPASIAPKAPASTTARMTKHGLGLAAIAGTAALVAAFALAVVGPSVDTLSTPIEAFQQRVAPDAGTPAMGQPAEKLLARRYIGPLSAEQREQIGDQVRAEQRSGFTLPGREAFVMRRLELYEEALGQARAVSQR